MATISTTRKTNPAQAAGKPPIIGPRRRQTAPLPQAPTEEPFVEETITDEAQRRGRDLAAKTGRAVALPLKEVLFVTVGLVDLAAEMLWKLERECAKRGERRTEDFKVVAGRAGHTASQSTTEMYSGAKEGMAKVSEKMDRGVRRMRRRTPSEESVPQPA